MQIAKRKYAGDRPSSNGSLQTVVNFVLVPDGVAAQELRNRFFGLVFAFF